MRTNHVHKYACTGAHTKNILMLASYDIFIRVLGTSCCDTCTCMPSGKPLPPVSSRRRSSPSPADRASTTRMHASNPAASNPQSAAYPASHGSIQPLHGDASRELQVTYIVNIYNVLKESNHYTKTQKFMFYILTRIRRGGYMPAQYKTAGEQEY